MIKTYDDAVNILSSYIPTKLHSGMHPKGLHRMQWLAHALGNPERQYPVIHVGGTSGKGSTSTIIAALLQKKYARVGLHTSPNFIRVNERMSINGVDISDTSFVAVAHEVLSMLDQFPEEKLGKPTYFELLTAMTFLHFSQKKVDVAVIEVGLGGTYDATNIVHPSVAVITSVGLDHTELLGDTVEKIAREKAGIIKEDIEVVTGVTQLSVIDILEQTCRSTNSILHRIGKDVLYTIQETCDTGSVWSYRSTSTFYDCIPLSLPGMFQVGNAACALCAVETFLHIQGASTLSESDLSDVLSHLTIPGRMEFISYHPTIILDGAHNPDKMNALVETMKALYPDRSITAILAIKEGKDMKDMLQHLLPICRNYIITTFSVGAESGIIHAYAPDTISSVLKTLASDVHVHCIQEPFSALQYAQKEARPDDIILVTGSLYLLGAIKQQKDLSYGRINFKNQ